MPDVTTTTASSGRCSIETSLSGSERAMSSSSRPGTTTVPSPATCASSGAAQRDLHVGRGEMQLAGFRAQLDPAEHEHGRARRDTACDERQLGRELVLRDA